MPIEISNSIICRILPQQVPQLWECIKFACVQADEVNKEDMPFYFNELLQALLNEKAQCFIRLAEDRTLLALMITRIVLDRITDKKHLSLQCLYSFKTVKDEVWERDWKFLLDFVKKEGCSYISYNSRHNKLWELGEMVGFYEKHRTYEIRVEGL